MSNNRSPLYPVDAMCECGSPSAKHGLDGLNKFEECDTCEHFKPRLLLGEVVTPSREHELYQQAMRGAL